MNTTGEAVTLQCTATSEGEITHWLHNGAVLNPASVSGVSVSTSAGSGGSSMLSISSYETSHAGDYRCAARSVSSQSYVEVSHGALVSHFGEWTCNLYNMFTNTQPVVCILCASQHYFLSSLSLSLSLSLSCTSLPLSSLPQVCVHSHTCTITR